MAIMVVLSFLVKEKQYVMVLVTVFFLAIILALNSNNNVGVPLGTGPMMWDRKKTKPCLRSLMSFW